jgi:hypothetical protein
LRDKKGMAQDMITERAPIMASSILMIMKCRSQERERKANEEEIDKSSVHQANNLPTMQRKVNGVYTVFLK